MTTRRKFLKQTAAATAMTSLPMLWTKSGHAQEANDRLTVASIGVGGSRGRYSRGGSIARNAAKLGQTIAVCDVDDRHTAEFNYKNFDGKLNMYRDYRDMFDNEKPDIVTIGTPDHSHVPIALHALRAGVDVYCEKPLTLTIDEGIQVRNAVEETGRIFQVGTQQRSECDLRFLQAIAIVKSGRLGNKVNAFASIGGAPTGGPFKPTDVPVDLDWDLWLGPAPKVDYCVERRKSFRWFFEYSGGKMTDWGAHHIDIAQWALGLDDTGPVKISGKGKLPPIIPDDFNWTGFLNGEISLPNHHNTATEFGINLEFANGSVLHVTNHYKRKEGNIDFGNGILFEGENGRMFVNRGKLQGKVIDQMTEKDKAEVAEAVVTLYKGREPGNHMKNFFECVEDRKDQPISDVATHHRTMTSCHMCNINLMLGRDLKWDPAKETFIGDEQAIALMARKSREVAMTPAGV